MGNPSQLKRSVYLLAATILGILLSTIAHGFIEMGYLRWVENQNLIVPFSGGCALPLELRSALWVFGAAGGFFLGRVWWQIVYIEKRHWRFRFFI